MAASIATRILVSQKFNITQLCRAFSTLVTTKNSFFRHRPAHTGVLSFTSFHTTFQNNGLEEFFEEKKKIGEIEVKSGRSWELGELRIKDSVTLHKLWYVLLKEKNMLLTMKLEAKRKKTFMPSPERIEKVEESMERLMQVVEERNCAVRELKTGQREVAPKIYTYNMFGEKVWRRLKEWPIPYHMNRKVQHERYSYYPLVVPFIRRRKELERKKLRVKAVKEKAYKRRLKLKFPHADIEI